MFIIDINDKSILKIASPGVEMKPKSLSYLFIASRKKKCGANSLNTG